MPKLFKGPVGMHAKTAEPWAAINGHRYDLDPIRHHFNEHTYKTRMKK